VYKRQSLKFLSILKNGNRTLINIDDIHYIKGARVYSELHLNSGKIEVHNKSLERLLQILPSRFERIHKSYLIDIHQIKNIKISPGGRYRAITLDGTELPVSRTRYKEIQKRLIG